MPHWTSAFGHDFAASKKAPFRQTSVGTQLWARPKQAAIKARQGIWPRKSCDPIVFLRDASARGDLQIGWLSSKMHDMWERAASSDLKALASKFPAILLLGARQVGKSSDCRPRSRISRRFRPGSSTRTTGATPSGRRLDAAGSRPTSAGCQHEPRRVRRSHPSGKRGVHE